MKLPLLHVPNASHVPHSSSNILRTVGQILSTSLFLSKMKLQYNKAKIDLLFLLCLFFIF